MRILIIGGSNFIGPYVVQALHDQGHEVILFNRGTTHCSFSFPVRSIHGDRTNLLSFKDQFISLSPDVVVDMIAYSENDAKQLADTFHGSVARIVVISSCDVYRAYDSLWNVSKEELIPMPLTESSPLRENFFPYRKIIGNKPNEWTYHYEKIFVEQTILAYPDINSTILRLPMVYGPGDYSRIYPYLKRMDDNRPILLDEKKANWRFCRGFVKDIANAIVLAALDTRIGNRIYHVGETYAYSELEWIQKIAKTIGWDKQIIQLAHDKLPAHLQEPLNWQQDLTLDTSRIREELNYRECYSARDALQESIDWLHANKAKQDVISSLDYEAEDNATQQVCAQGRVSYIQRVLT